MHVFINCFKGVVNPSSAIEWPSFPCAFVVQILVALCVYFVWSFNQGRHRPLNAQIFTAGLPQAKAYRPNIQYPILYPVLVYSRLLVWLILSICKNWVDFLASVSFCFCWPTYCIIYLCEFNENLLAKICKLICIIYSLSHSLFPLGPLRCLDKKWCQKLCHNKDFIMLKREAKKRKQNTFTTPVNGNWK